MTGRRDGWPLLWWLSAAQLVSWGAVYYSFSLFVVPMEAELGWSRTAINGALSLGLLTAGLAAYPVGAWIDRRGGRAVMTAGSVLATHRCSRVLVCLFPRKAGASDIREGLKKGPWAPLNPQSQLKNLLGTWRRAGFSEVT